MNEKFRNIGKLFCILAGLVFLFCLWLHQQESRKEVPEGEKITVEDVRILLEALEMPVDVEMIFAESNQEMTTNDETEQETYFTYNQYKALYEQIGGTEKGIPDFAEKYEGSFAMLKEDWYAAYQFILAHYDTDSSIWKTTIFILQVDEQEKKLYTQNSEYSYCSSSFEHSFFCKEEVYVKGGQLLTSVRKLDERTILENVWVMESTEGVMDCFYHHVMFQVNGENPAEREQIADLTFENGKLIEVQVKSDKIRGKLLSVSDNEIEVEGYGTYEIADNLEVYKLFGTLENQGKEDLMLGYDYTDFVIWKDKICAALVAREGELDQIRVLLKNTADGTYYYEEATVLADGEEITVTARGLEEGERISFQAQALTDKVMLQIDGVDKADNAFRGKLEFCKTKQGMIIVNELPLEEYLYAVVPSEMPASYPLEALKAQAVCARTYAYRYILQAGLGEYGAHLDDTTAYQVYHNISENAATTTAVKETTGMMLYYGEELAQNYYYSTSCGYGTDANVWKSGSEQDVSYILAGKYAKQLAGEENNAADITVADNEQGMESNNTLSAQDMTQEENFAAFIQTVDELDFEKDEPWYRWTYEIKELDAKKILSRIQSRYQANASLILKQVGEGESAYYVSEPIEEIGEIKNIQIEKRGVGGVADELVITGSRATIKVISEYNIRSVLCDGDSEVIRQDGSITVPGTLLPSGFFIIETGKSGEEVIGYKLLGGGYGHGVGMSQNGAKAMGKLGYRYQEILGTFFADCEVQE
ncbi:MAG: SpoIID/LytB domain-containing protein [Lachnospiraceae bacterium]|nr:SpoIID/LytB domain-containing protein [Lachnospiraceae bacterium]